MRKALLPLHLRNIIIRGFEEETPEQKAAREAAEAEEGDDDDDDDDADKGKDKAKDNDGLVSALQKERKAAKEAQRALRAAQKRLDELDAKDKSDTDKAKDTASKAESQVQKLAGKLLKAEVDNSITKLAGELKFRDIDDALKLVDRSLIEVEQDDDDPSDIDLDLESVKSALAKLAKSKPHLIMAEGQGDKSGSKFNGSKKPTKDAEDEAIRSKYPALRRSSHTA
jgi:hypothetical protein